MQSSNNFNVNKHFENSQLFSKEEWEKYYTAADYTNKTDRLKAFPLHFYLSLFDNEETILVQLNKLKDKDLTIFTKKDPKCFQFTPLHIAAMRAQKSVFSKLVSILEEKNLLKDALNQMDEKGWTPWHHAAVSSDEIFRTLQEKGALGVLSHGGASPEHVRALAGRVTSRQSMEAVFLDVRDCSMTQLSKLSDARIQELTGLMFYNDCSIYPPETRKSLWNGHDQANDLTLQAYHAAFAAYKAWQVKKPKLVIRECPELTGKMSLPMGIYAGEFLPKGSGVGEYSGLVRKEITFPLFFLDAFKPAFTEDSFVLKDRSGKYVGNVTRFSNFGFPNSIMVDLDGIEGDHRNILMTIDDVKENEEIVWCYGICETNLVYGKQVLLRRKEMREFFKEGLRPLIIRQEVLYKLLRKDMPPKKINQKYASEINQIEPKFTFPLHCPGAVLDLHFSRLVNASEWDKLLVSSSIPSIQGYYRTKNQESFMLRSFIKRIEEFEGILEKSPELREKVSAWVLNSIGELSIMKILKGFQDIARDFVKNPSQVLDWGTYQKQLEKNLAEYDWMQDLHAPLGLEQRKKDILSIYLSMGLSKKELLQMLRNQLKETESVNLKNTELYVIITWLIDQIAKNKN